ncbi:MAG: ABC transporter substrate-binding protein [Chloroflexota bacterium]
MRKLLRITPVIVVLALFLSIGIHVSFAQDAKPAECKADAKTINFWHGLTGPDGAYLADMVKKYNTENTDNLCVILTVYNWDVFFDKWLSGVAAGTPPDVVIYHINELPQYASQGAVTPIDDLAKDVGLDVSAFPETQQTYSHYDGKLYGIPLDVHPIAMYMNTDLVKAAGLDPAKPPTDQKTFLDWAQKLTKPDGSQFGVCFASVNVQSFRVWYGWIYQNGGKFISDDNKQIVVDSPENEEVTQFAVDLVNKYKVAPQGEQDPDTDFQNGKCALHFQGPWWINGFAATKGLNFATAPQPVMFKQPGVWASDHFFGISTQDNLDNQKAGIKFVKWMNDNANLWGLSGMVPVDEAIRTGKDYTSTDIYKYQKAFVDELPYTHLTPVVKQSTEIFAENNQTPLVVNFQAALLGAKDVKTALADMQTGIQAVLDKES